jgi:hypothetical protein
MLSLDQNVRAVFNDSRLLNHVVTAICLDQNSDYVRALEAFHAAVENAISDGTSSLGSVLKWVPNTDAEYVAKAMSTLERRDTAVTATYDAAVKPLLREKADKGGRVLLDQRAAGGKSPKGMSTDIGRILGDPKEFERRLSRIRRVQPDKWLDTEGRERFRHEDRLLAEAGLDLVRSAERPLDLVSAQAQAQRVAARLDAAVAIESDKHAKLIALDEAIGHAEDGRLRMLEQNAKPKGKKRKLDAASAVPVADDPVQDRAKQLDEFDRRVRERMTQLDAPESAYPQVLARMLGEVGQTGTVSPPWAPRSLDVPEA